MNPNNSSSLIFMVFNVETSSSKNTEDQNIYTNVIGKSQGKRQFTEYNTGG